MQIFQSEMEKHQIKWRKNNIENQEWGVYDIEDGKIYEHVLPEEIWEEGLFRPLRKNGKIPLNSYLVDNCIVNHPGVHNLKSSWANCANLFFPFRDKPELLKKFVEKKLKVSIKKINQLELEFAEEKPFDPHTLLGEPIGKRGQGQTSPDVGIVFEIEDGRKGLLLIENKLVEKSFYNCSGTKDNNGDTHPEKCRGFERIYKDLSNSCFLFNWQYDKRKYWDYMLPKKESLKKMKYCPAAYGGYQLFRQQALAEALLKTGKYSAVFSGVAYDKRNVKLIKCLSRAGIYDFTKGWGNIFHLNTGFFTFTHQEWVSFVKDNDRDGEWKEWHTYIIERYGYEAF
ncbi:hypothetical protein ACFL35_10655 [Candidatus Riflebacteria bacterium]